jgi:catechol 2,3-dioxygenase-like lactoylglutathione lyase family enzyme
MGKIRHIAYRAQDPEAMATFFVEGLGMALINRREGGAIDLSDGTLNITVLPPGLVPLEGEAGNGIAHIGFTVEDEAESARAIKAAGGREANTVRMDSAHYEVKFQGPEGIVVDLGHWLGTAPISEPEQVASKAN